MALIAAERLSIGPAGRSLAGDIAFTLSAGQIIAVLGANGVGKSTLFRTLLHLQPARSGSVLLDGIGIGGLFAGESMFHDPESGRDASKVALVALVELLREAGGAGRLLDVQWQTPHLASLGVIEIDREDYLRRLRRALRLSAPLWTTR